MARYGPAKTQEEIDDAIDEWHELYGEDDDYVNQNIDLFDYLGWTHEQYKVWLETDKIPEFDE